MRKCVFRASIRGRDLVQKTGPIRVPTSFRIRIYDDGEAVITTRGRFDDSVEGSKYFGGEKRGREYSFEAVKARLLGLVKESYRPTKQG